ncbi:hypothetical protein CL658_00255 [bacterium]|nr:hypothetical protein [bacterium]
MKLRDLTQNLPDPIFLVDASGVLYSSNGFLKNSGKTFKYLQEKGPTFLASNNSYHYVNDISQNLYTEGKITLNPEYIISSGHGLAKDPHISKLICNKIVYFIGPKSALHYALDVPIKAITKTIQHAEAIILAGFNQSQSTPLLNTVIKQAKENPSIPIICCNKDLYIRANQGLQPVVGYFAKKIEKEIKRPLNWFGKPLKNFSNLVKNHLKNYHLNPSKSTLFFDDNLENVIAMQNHLGISGCWVTETGIFYNKNKNNLLKHYGIPSYIIKSFSLDEFLIQP